MKSYRHLLSILAGVGLFTFLLFVNPFHFDPKAARIAAAAGLMITWWIFEAMPLPVVGLLPLVLFPVLGIANIEETAIPFANPMVFLCLGGFFIGLSIEKWNLHKRIALNIVRITGTSGDRIILGFMIATGFLSMWLSNTATTMMMFPIAMSVIKVMEETHTDHVGSLKNLSVCLMLAIAYAANLCGIGTIIGTTPNVAYVAFLEKEYHYAFDFREWMTLCAPLAWTLVFILYFLLVKVLYPNKIPASAATREVINNELHSLGKISSPEKRVLGVFALTVTLWITRDLLNAEQLQSWILSVVRGHTVTHETFLKLDDTMISMFGGLLLFIVPSHGPVENSKQLLEWEDTPKVAWGILFLFGGGITMAAQLEKAGIIQMLGANIGSLPVSGFWLIFLVAIVSVFISELMSNMAQVIVFTPVVAGLATTLHMNPLQLGMAVTLAASCAGMMPMGTPPNAIVFASGRLRLAHMITTGLIMNIIASGLVALFCWYLLPLVITAIT